MTIDTAIGRIEDPVDRFVAYMVEREAVRRRKEAGEPRPWTGDVILQAERFTNYDREHDRTSRWYQRVVREPLDGTPFVLPATVLFRWFNHERTSAAIFGGGDPPFALYLASGDVCVLVEAVDRQGGPYTSAAYVIASSALYCGLPKQHGILAQFHHWMRRDWRRQAERWAERNPTLAAAAASIAYDAPGLGGFMAAQIVADLKHTHLLAAAPDWWTWSASGPGSRRGLNRILRRPVNSPWVEAEWHQRAEVLRATVRRPLDVAGLPPLDAQGVQHNLCEFDKMERVRLGEAERTKRRFR